MSSRYVKAWESFWRDTPAAPGSAIWDSAPEVTAALHTPLFEPLMDTSLPIVDLGCGNGTQTRYLADRFPRAVGIDLSKTAIERARQTDPPTTAEFRQVNAAEKDVMEQLHAELGDANVYMRGIIHQSEPEDRPRVAGAASALLGGRGRLFCLELAAAAKPLLRSLAQSAAGPPPKLASVFGHGLTPAEVDDEAVPELFREAGLEPLARGSIPLFTTEHRPDGTRLDLPMTWLLAGRADA